MRDPLSGEVVWTRKNVPAGSDLFGDDELLFVVPPDSGEALVLRALDGTCLGRRTVPAFEQRMTTQGRNVLSWESREGRPVVVMRDAFTGGERWSHSFAAARREPWSRATRSACSKTRAVSSWSGCPTDRSWSKISSPGADAEHHLSAGLGESVPAGHQFAGGEPSAQRQHPSDAGPSQRPFDQRLALRVCPQRRAGRRGGRPAGASSLWPEPCEIRQQGLALTQPDDVPLLFFMSQKNSANNAGQHESRTTVLAVDKRTGRKVYKNESLRDNSITNFKIVADQANARVDLLIPNKKFSFRLTDDPPLTPEQELEANRKGVLGEIGGALIRAKQADCPGRRWRFPRGRRLNAAFANAGRVFRDRRPGRATARTGQNSTRFDFPQARLNQLTLADTQSYGGASCGVQCS